MSGQLENGAVGRGRQRFSGAMGAVMLAAGLLGGCSSVPDYANPAAWYRGLFGEKKAEAPSAERVPAAGASQPYPNLGTVPARPRDASSAQERTNIQQGLLADRANAQYTDETLAPGGTPRPSAAAPTPARAAIAPPPGAPPPAPASALALAAPPAPAAPAPSAPTRTTATIGGAAPQASLAQATSTQQATPTQATPAPAAPAPAAAAAPARSLPPTTAQTQTGMSRAQALVQALQADSPPSTSRQRPPVPAVAAPVAQPIPPAPAMTQPPRALTPPAPPAAMVPAAPVPAMLPPPPIASQRPALVAPAQGTAGTEAAYRQALAQSETATQQPVLVPPQQAAAPTLGMTLPRSRQVYDPRALATIPFVSGSIRLSNADLQTLREVAEIHQRRGGMLRVVGHARQEGAGNAANQQVTNFRVSGDRADAVAQALVRLGVSGAMIDVEAHGDGEPATTALGQPDPAASRRVEIYLDN